MSSQQQNQDTEPTTLGSFLTHGTGLVQETVGSLLGNESLKQQGTANIEQANQAAKDAAPSKTSGNLNTIIGGVKEEVGRVVGNINLTQSGSEQRNDGNTEYNAAKAERVIDGAKDKVTGKVQSGFNAALGDKDAQEQAQAKAAQGDATMQHNKLG
ncbi:hypothetical protein BGW37DRAFT_503488 [Umbelopsis sp. PMI_123]|nr:hypothetical protein BGW37DRAFT_503488 [Umbelopsis sp. PMI_123]